jgi:hypothetical protein
VLALFRAAPAQAPLAKHSGRNCRGGAAAVRTLTPRATQELLDLRSRVPVPPRSIGGFPAPSAPASRRIHPSARRVARIFLSIKLRDYV